MGNFTDGGWLPADDQIFNGQSIIILRPQIDALNEEWRGRKAREAIAQQFGEPGRARGC